MSLASSRKKKKARVAGMSSIREERQDQPLLVSAQVQTTESLGEHGKESGFYSDSNGRLLEWES